MRREPHDRRGGHVLRAGRTRISRWKKTRYGTGGEEIGGWPRCPDYRGIARQKIRSRHPFGDMIIVLVAKTDSATPTTPRSPLSAIMEVHQQPTSAVHRVGVLLVDTPSANELYRLTSLPSRRAQSPLFLNLRQQRRSSYLQHSFPCSRCALASTRL